MAYLFFVYLTVFLLAEDIVMLTVTLLYLNDTYV